MRRCQEGMQGRLFYTRVLCQIALLLVIANEISADGTTKKLENIFYGRCYDFHVEKMDGPLNVGVDLVCSHLWEKFRKAFAFKPSCDLDTTSYSSFLDATKQVIPENKNLFWSGTKEYAHRLSLGGTRYVTMEDTMTGDLADKLQWCGQEDNPGIDYEHCPGFTDCDNSAVSVYWKAASANFAAEAKGDVYLLLNGSDPNVKAYRNNSIFATIELPMLNVSKVSAVNVMLAYGLGQPKLETCNSGSLLELRKAVEAKPLIFRCEENPEAVMYLMCVDDIDNEECDLEDEANASGKIMFNQKLISFGSFFTIFVYRFLTHQYDD